MVLVNFVEFVVFKILFDLVSMQNLLNANTDDINKIRKTALPDLIFIFNVLLRSATGFI